MAKKKKTYAKMTREERVTGKVPKDTPAGIDKDSREYHATHGWPKENK